MKNTINEMKRVAELLQGIFIQKVYTDSIAEKFGIKVGDIILTINDEPALPMMKRVFHNKIKFNTISIWRAGEELTFQCNE